jgi:hypothetical protein
MSGRGFPSPWTVDEDRTPASSCAMRMGRRSAISISKKILGEDQRASCSPKMKPEGSL